MPEPARNPAFTVTPGTPTVIQVNDQEGKPHEITAQVGVLAVRPTGKRDPNSSASTFEVDFQVLLKTTEKK